MTETAHRPDKRAFSPQGSPTWRRRVGRAVAFCVAGTLVLLVLLVGGLHRLGNSDFGGERLRLEAQRMVTALVGRDIVATIGSTRLSFDPDRFLVLEIEKAGLADGETGDAFLEAGRLRFGVRLLPLLEGRFQLANATLSDARIVADRLPDTGGPGPLAGLRDGEGLLDPSLVTPAIFRFAGRVFDLVEDNSARLVTLENVQVVLDSRTGLSLDISKALLERRSDGDVSIDGRAVLEGHPLRFTTSASREGERIAALDMEFHFDPIDVADDVQPGRRIGRLALRVSGSQGDAAGGDEVAFDVTFDDTELSFGNAGTLTASGVARAGMKAGSDRIEILALEMRSGATEWRLRGSAGPGGEAYTFQLDGSGAQAASLDGVAPIAFAATLSGRFDPDARHLTADAIELTPPQGRLFGSAGVRFAPGKSPGLELDLAVQDMQVEAVKAVWPWFVARGARNWVSRNVVDGQVVAGELGLVTVPGQLGNGVPLSHEVFGRFELTDTTILPGGELPALRETDGALVFDGSRIDISIGSARSTLPGGKSIDARNGVFGLDFPRDRPLVGELDVEIEGDADAVLEFARLRPIDAGRFIDFEPSELSGTASGRARVDIPLSPAAMARLDWDVNLDFDDLAIARPFEGQNVTDATGSVRILPGYAEISATARLNGMPADIALVEPFGANGVARSRKIEVSLDDTGRDALVPALSTLLSGQASVAFDLSAESRQSVTADLSGSILSLPWIGWSKGAGIAATTAFQMERSGGQTFLHDFGLRGDTFAINGTVSLDEKGLAKASLPRVRLNRGDDFAVDIERSGSGYAISVSGNVLDARSALSAVKRMVQSPPAQDAPGGTASPAISLDLKMTEVTGFNGQTLRDVTLAYRGEGTTIEDLRLTGTTASGGQVKMNFGLGMGGRTIRIETSDAGAALAFFDVYKHMEGGQLALALRSADTGGLAGQMELRNFFLVNEPRLRSLVSTPSDARGRSLGEIVRGNLEVTRARFERAYAEIRQGPGFLDVENGILRGTEIGSSFQGRIYDAAGNMAMTGTFMPAYGVNRLFGEIPLIGQILGNGRDRGLIGITFKLEGPAGDPQLQINPLSAIAPGIFRSVFEFR